MRNFDLARTLLLCACIIILASTNMMLRNQVQKMQKLVVTASDQTDDCIELLEDVYKDY